MLRQWHCGLVAMAALMGGCPEDEAPSSGRCEGYIGSIAVDGDIDPDQSGFTLYHDFAGLEHTSAEMYYGSRPLYLTLHGEHTPDDSWLTTSPLSSSSDAEFYLGWYVGAEELPDYSDGTITFTGASRSRLVGEFTANFVDGTSMTCTFDLLRSY